MGGADYAPEEQDATVNVFSHNLTSEERDMLDQMLAQWGAHITRNQKLFRRYDGEVKVKDLGISTPPAALKKLQDASVQWSKQAVKAIADGSVIEGFRFAGPTPAGFDECVRDNKLIEQYDETLPSQLVCGPAFYTVTAGDAGEPPAVVSTYDAEHATALYNFRKHTNDCGLAIVDIKRDQSNMPTDINFYSPDGSIVEATWTSGGTWATKRLSYSTGHCMMEVMRYDPDKKHPFGNSVITPAMAELEDKANRAIARTELAAEIYNSPVRYIAGAEDGIFKSETWSNYMGNLLTIPTNEEGQNPDVGTFAQGSMEPHIALIRHYTQLFANESDIPISALLNTEANPTSAEAMEAARYNMVEKIRKVNRLNGHTLKTIGLLMLSIIEETPFSELGDIEKSLEVKWRNPLHPSLGASADAAQKIAATTPGFANTTMYWRMLGYTDSEIEAILAEMPSEVPATTDEPKGDGDGATSPILSTDN